MDFSALNPLTSNSVNLAARAGDVRRLRRLLRRGRCARLPDNRGWTAVHEAAAAGREEALALLLDGPDARPLDRTFDGQSALHLAVGHSDSAPVVRLLLRREPRLLEARTPEMRTALHLAAGGGDGRAAQLQLLLEAGADLQPRDADGDAPLHEAVRAASPAAVAALLHAGAQPDSRNDYGLTPFLLAAFKRDLPCVVEIFPFVVDVDDCAYDGNTALILAAQRGALDVVEFLLERGADPDLANDEGVLPLRAALMREHAAVVRRLLSATDPRAIDRDVFNSACDPLHFSTEAVAALLESDLPPEFFNEAEVSATVPERIFGFAPEYSVRPPACSILNVVGYAYGRSRSLGESLLWLFLTKGAAVDPLGPEELPPLAHLQGCEAAVSEPEILDVLLALGCDVDYCSSPTARRLRAPDAVCASVASGGLALPSLLRRSLLTDPELVLERLVGSDSIAERIPPEILLEVSSMCCPSAETLEALRRSLSSRVGGAAFSRRDDLSGALEPRAPSLKHLCRKAARDGLRPNVRSTRQFFDALGELRLPPSLESYLRFA